MGGGVIIVCSLCAVALLGYAIVRGGDPRW